MTGMRILFILALAGFAVWPGLSSSRIKVADCFGWERGRGRLKTQAQQLYRAG